MADIFSKKKRSEIMSKIRSKNTKVEKLIFKELRRKKIYFQKHYKGPFGNIDIALPKKKRAVFIDGGFWHGHDFKNLKKRLSKDFWLPKIEGNMKRDRISRNKLRRNGWEVLKIWEHDIEKNPAKYLFKIKIFLKEK